MLGTMISGLKPKLFCTLLNLIYYSYEHKLNIVVNITYNIVSIFIHQLNYN